MDVKELLKFIADVLYMKGIICYEEIDAIYDVRNGDDLEKIVEKMNDGSFNVYKKGEGYWHVYGKY